MSATPSGCDIQVFDVMARLLSESVAMARQSAAWAPALLGLDGQGNLYVPEPENDRVLKFAPDGTLLATWGSPGNGDGQLDFPVDAAVDATGNVFVTDFGNNRVQVFDATGRFLATWGGFGAGEGQLKQPIALALDGEGNIYVVEFLNGRVQKFRLLPPFGPPIGATAS